MIFPLLCLFSGLTFLVVVYILIQLKSLNSDAETDKIKELITIEFRENRKELSGILKENREELSTGIDKLTEKLDEKFKSLGESLKANAKDDREAVTNALKEFKESFYQSVKDFNELQKQKFGEMGLKQDKLVETTNERLEKMRETVDEKLHKTLEERLGQSFKLVSDRLEAVQKGLGEMQSLASGVGDLKKVLSNVKTRGVLGEIQLGNILEQILAPEQYDKNVKTKSGSDAHVEFAIKLPGNTSSGKEIYLPIDAKFPQEDFIRLQTAYDAGDVAAIETANKDLMRSIKNFAKDIKNKYIDPPNTTDFGIMFLPIEGLFAEVARQPEMITLLQREYKIVVTGPTTLAAMLNSLHMGFRTLAIQKRTSEVWNVLGAVKTEFGKFGGVLAKAQKKINEANNEIDSLVGTRTRMMLSKLKKVEELPSSESDKLIDDVIDYDEE
ncbi:MAG: DNA recombination protein RmuC [Crocinitomicaceae bacterium]|tara:strand:- start:10196 stop:11521 length:1326 start_codon:yes stop_codon:yes gene_type:complete